MKSVAIFIGTRPEAIKMAPVIESLSGRAGIRTTVVSTGQHREMLEQITKLFSIEINHRFDVMVPNQTLAGLTGRVVQAVDDFIATEQPDFALVQGDTTTVLAAALASFYRRVPIGHVEAGLRTGNLESPFPEEANRVLTSRMATLHFAPTERAVRALISEGIAASSILQTGNTVVDALLRECRRQEEATVRDSLAATLRALLPHDEAEDRRMVLVTGHRRENFGAGLEAICEAISQLSGTYPSVDFVYPVHLNPHVLGPVRASLGDKPNVHLIPPQPYDVFVALMRRCDFILTDSGGVQEEAPSLGKPVLVMRDTTERPEGVEAGAVKLVGAHTDMITYGVSELLGQPEVYRRMSNTINPYGDGRAAERIADSVHRYLYS